MRIIRVSLGGLVSINGIWIVYCKRSRLEKELLKIFKGKF